jgi:hypothetical protein
MFSITASTTIASTNKRLKKFGKKMKKQRQEDLSRIGDKFKDISRDEERRAKEIFKHHKEFFQDKTGTKKTETNSIDFFEA